MNSNRAGDGAPTLLLFQVRALPPFFVTIDTHSQPLHQQRYLRLLNNCGPDHNGAAFLHVRPAIKISYDIDQAAKYGRQV